MNKKNGILKFPNFFYCISKILTIFSLLALYPISILWPQFLILERHFKCPEVKLRNFAIFSLINGSINKLFSKWSAVYDKNQKVFKKAIKNCGPHHWVFKLFVIKSTERFCGKLQKGGKRRQTLTFNFADSQPYIPCAHKI